MTNPDWQSLVAAARRAIERGDGDTAMAALAQARRSAPDERAVRYWLGNALRLTGRPAEAEAEFRALLRAESGDADSAFALAWLLREQGRPDAAAEALLAVSRAPGADLDRLLRVAGFLRDSNRYTDAIDVLERALALRAEDAGLRFRLARLYQATGRFDDALAQLRDATERDASLGGAWLSLAQLQRFDAADAPDFRRLRKAAARPAGPEAEMCLAFALGKAYDDIGEWRDAWHHYTRGNALRRAAQPWDRESWRRQCRAALTAAQQPAPIPPHPERHPVYIVGMLRSGTTLLEQLLDRHPRVTGRGELNLLARLAQSRPPHDRATAAATLWTHLRLDGREDGYYIDKNPLNFRFLGLLAETLPEARIVHVLRDGRDSCLSCHFQLFQHPDAGFTDDLGDLLKVYRDYRRLMGHWQQTLGERLCTVRYEALVRDADEAVRRVLAFLDLEPAAAAEPSGGPERPVRTASAWQARQPVYRASIGRWRNYREFAPEFFDALQTLDEE